MADPSGFMYFPPAGFYFDVDIDGLGDVLDTTFQEASGIEVERELEEITEGGVNDYKHRLPKRTSFSNLVLKRGLVTAGSGIAEWCEKALFSNLGEPIEPKTIIVQLLSTTDAEPLMAWTFARAYPVKWNISGFNSQENGIVTETLEFAFQSFKIKK